MSNKSPRVLDVGQCDFDHGNITRMLSQCTQATVDRSTSADDAFIALQNTEYDLVLVNRLFDADGASGMEFIKKIKQESATRAIPVMLVSNFVNAQDEAVDLGAVRGFGKDALNDPRTGELLGSVLIR